MELRHLRYFITVAEELHFGRAAERLHMAQPPLSQQIRQLEAELGFELFHRTKRQVRLTKAGHVFLVAAQQILLQVEQAILAGQRASRGETGHIVIGFVSSAAYNVMPTILKTFRAQFPDVNLTLHELTTDQQLQWLQDGRLDVGFLRPPIKNDQLICKTIFQEPFVVALPAAHPLAQQPSISILALINEPFILFPRHLGPGLYDQIISLCQQSGFSPNVIQEAIQMQTIVSLVAAEMGIALVPASLQNLQRAGVIYKAVQTSTPKAEIAVIWKQHDTSPTLQKLLDSMLSHDFDAGAIACPHY
ncbi:MAG: LysR family transcriptional regulator [Cyanothece sp. SIO1E1]|nr:LysR family transcriptional regulator [Cyanothece sp. SIO1E1]